MQEVRQWSSLEDDGDWQGAQGGFWLLLMFVFDLGVKHMAVFTL